ncbi:MAG: PDZ domain-containing protein [Alphaproteobacteria bacterium]|nr:PDZ domain-containing protein [Alphaproteobacteria bacterium]
MLWTALLLLLATVTAVADDAPPPAPYTRTVELVHDLYLDRAQVDPEDLLHAAADALASRLDWLMVEHDGTTVRLARGGGSALGEVRVTSWADLPQGLFALEQLAEQAGAPADDLQLRWATLGGATHALDRFSRVLVGEGLDRFDTRLKGTLVGIGAGLAIEGDRLAIVDVFEGSPAEAAGVQPGDWIDRIDGRSTVSMPVREAQRLIRGDEGTTVVLDLQRPAGAASHAVRATLTRARIILPNVVHRVLEGNVGYVRIDNISQKTEHNLRRALSDLIERGGLGQGLVLDLRGNTGGSMKESARVVDQFVKDGLLLATVGADGQPVRNLLSLIQARDQGDEPPVPVVVLVDRATASGAEIITGGLVEHGRAVVLGERTYGKGKVQKVYEIDEDARLKLTVAEYVLANDRRVGEDGLPPDLSFGAVVLDDDGVHLGEAFDLTRERVSYDTVVPMIDERAGWRGVDREPGDLVLEVARRAALTAAGPDRADVLVAAARAATAVRAEEDAYLVSALAARQLDWSAAQGQGTPPEATVQVALETDPAEPERHRVRVTLTNTGPTTLHRTLVRFRSPTLSTWSSVVVPVGAVPSGETRSGSALLQLRPGLPPREDVVIPEILADRRPPRTLPELVLPVQSGALPDLRLIAYLTGEGIVRTAQIVVHNASDRALSGLEAELAYPRTPDFELLDHGARHPLLGPGTAVTFELGVQLGEGTELPQTLPLRLRLRADGVGRLLSWDVPLPLDGTPVGLQAPTVQARLTTLSSPPGELQLPVALVDDGRIASATVFVNGQKVLYAPGRGPRLDLVARIPVEPGANRILVRAVDDQGLVTRRWWSVLGTGGSEGVRDVIAEDGADDVVEAELMELE